MTVHWTPAVVVLTVLLLIVATAVVMSRPARRRLLSSDTKSKFGLLLFVVLFAVSACSSEDRATSPEEVHKLAGSSDAVQARQQTEGNLLSVVRAYADHTPLTLALVTVRDTCHGGSAKEWFFQTGDDTYKIACSLGVTAYYGADPKRMGDVIDGILTAGDHHGSLISFGHDQYRRNLVDYYRGHGPNPAGPQAPEPSTLSDTSQSLTWDPVHDRNPPTRIQEPDQCLQNDPPVTRCLHEPESATVAAIRKKHGMVFKLELGSANYYKVYKNGRTTG
ncbi:hypothetical protein OG285_25280 [Streptomyces sp. NBC_01471]|uniref:hypothetical protein n=1 Tax=Streptomyces sp. NBC_01471 TaxID=2903879 RepID=UPI003243234E